MAILSVTMEFDVMCQRHNRSLKTIETKVRGYDVMYVESCDECLEEADTKGFEAGLKDRE